MAGLRWERLGLAAAQKGGELWISLGFFLFIGCFEGFEVEVFWFWDSKS